MALTGRAAALLGAAWSPAPWSAAPCWSAVRCARLRWSPGCACWRRRSTSRWPGRCAALRFARAGDTARPARRAGDRRRSWSPTPAGAGCAAVLRDAWPPSRRRAQRRGTALDVPPGERRRVDTALRPTRRGDRPRRPGHRALARPARPRRPAGVARRPVARCGCCRRSRPGATCRASWPGCASSTAARRCWCAARAPSSTRCASTSTATTYARSTGGPRRAPPTSWSAPGGPERDRRVLLVARHRPHRPRPGSATRHGSTPRWTPPCCSPRSPRGPATGSTCWPTTAGARRGRGRPRPPTCCRAAGAGDGAARARLWSRPTAGGIVATVLRAVRPARARRAAHRARPGRRSRRACCRCCRRWPPAHRRARLGARPARGRWLPGRGDVEAVYDAAAAARATLAAASAWPSVLRPARRRGRRRRPRRACRPTSPTATSRSRPPAGCDGAGVHGAAPAAGLPAPRVILLRVLPRGRLLLDWLDLDRVRHGGAAGVPGPLRCHPYRDLLADVLLLDLVRRSGGTGDRLAGPRPPAAYGCGGQRPGPRSDLELLAQLRLSGDLRGGDDLQGRQTGAGQVERSDSVRCSRSPYRRRAGRNPYSSPQDRICPSDRTATEW